MKTGINRTDSAHSLTAKDHREFNKAEQMIFNEMSDQSWHTAQSLIDITGQREALRRMRSLRSHRQVAEIQKRRDGDSREFLYRMILA